MICGVDSLFTRFYYSGRTSPSCKRSRPSSVSSTALIGYTAAYDFPMLTSIFVVLLLRHAYGLPFFLGYRTSCSCSSSFTFPFRSLCAHEYVASTLCSLTALTVPVGPRLLRDARPLGTPLRCSLPRWIRRLSCVRRNLGDWPWGLWPVPPSFVILYSTGRATAGLTAVRTISF